MTNITTLRPGEHFMFKNFEWVCLDGANHDGAIAPACVLNPKSLNLRQSMAYVEEREGKENATD